MWNKMVVYIIKRILSSLVSLIIVTIIIFSVMHSIPGGPFDEEKMPLSPAAKEKILEMYGLNDPLYVQYFKFMWNALHFNFGKSYQSPGEEIIDLVKRTLPISAFMGGLGLAWAITAGLLLGIVSARKPILSLIIYVQLSAVIVSLYLFM